MSRHLVGAAKRAIEMRSKEPNTKQAFYSPKMKGIVVQAGLVKRKRKIGFRLSTFFLSILKSNVEGYACLQMIILQ